MVFEGLGTVVIFQGEGGGSLPSGSVELYTVVIANLHMQNASNREFTRQ